MEVCRLVSPAEGTGALAPVRFNKLHCAPAWTDIRALHIVRTTTTTRLRQVCVAVVSLVTNDG